MRIDSYLKENNSKQYPFEVTIYVKTHRDELLIIVLYVDDMFFMGNN
jgi:hypothetical protein